MIMKKYIIGQKNPIAFTPIFGVVIEFGKTFPFFLVSKVKLIFTKIFKNLTDLLFYSFIFIKTNVFWREQYVSRWIFYICFVL